MHSINEVCRKIGVDPRLLHDSKRPDLEETVAFERVVTAVTTTHAEHLETYGALRADRFYLDCAEHAEMAGLAGSKTVGSPELMAFAAANGGSGPDAKLTLDLALRKFVRGLAEQIPPLLPKQMDPGVTNALTKQAEGVVQHLESDFEAKLPTTSGFLSIDAYAEAAAQAGPTVARVMELLDKEQVSLAIMVESTPSRPFIAGTGILNQHSSGAASTYAFNGARGKNALEASSLGKSYDDYAAFNPLVKPKSGLLWPALDGVARHHVGASDDAHLGLEAERPMYGNDVYLLKPDRVRDRLTLTIGDHGNRATRPGVEFRKGETYAPERWDDFFIPWKHRKLLMPFMTSAFARGSMGIALDGQCQVGGGLGRAQSVPAWNDKTMFSGCKVPAPAEAALRELSYGKDPDTKYVEFQVFGPVDVAKDVEAFVFKFESPRGDHLAYLLEHDIPIFDGSKWPPKPWTPRT